jgi:hypothetical protein
LIGRQKKSASGERVVGKNDTAVETFDNTQSESSLPAKNQPENHLSRAGCQPAFYVGQVANLP